MCVSVNLAIFGSANSLSPIGHHAITWTYDDLSIGIKKVNFGDVFTKI